MKKLLFTVLLLVWGLTSGAAAFFIDFEDGRNNAPISNIQGVSFKNFNGYHARYGDSRVGYYNTCSDDLNRCYSDANFHHRGNLWLWAGKNADAQGVIVDFTNNNGTWFKTGYSSFGTFILEARLTNGGSVTVTGPTNTDSPMGYLRVDAPSGTCIDYVILRGDLGNAWLVDDMSGDTTGVGSEEPPPPDPDSDHDGDGMPYAWEVAHGLNPEVNDAGGDADGDGLSNLTEYQKGTDPRKADTDGDGIPDGWEANHGLNPSVHDSGADSDGDGLSNLTEYQQGTHPTNADTDGDGMPDGWETAQGLNPNVNDAASDPDGDGLSNLREYQKGTDPQNPDTDGDGMPDGWEVAYDLNPGVNDASEDPDGDEVSNLDEHLNGTNPITIPGEFTVGEDGLVEIDWLYDGGMYQGEFGIFSFSEMKPFVSDPEAFIREAVRRALSNSEEGYVVFSDPTEGARFDGALGEYQEWNSGPYMGVRSFDMRPGDTFATILVPNSTLEAVYDDPGTQNANKRPLFSLVLSNLDYGMHVGQMADVNGMGTAFVYEDQDFSHSDMDYNDVIVQIKGATVDVPALDSLISDPEDVNKRRRSKRDGGNHPVLYNAPSSAPFWYDWRISESLGRQLMAHIETPSVQPDTLWLSVTIEGPADLVLYDPRSRECGKAGGYIPGAAFKLADDSQTISLPSLETGNYRVVLRGQADGTCHITVKGYQGDTEIASQTEYLDIQAHQSLRVELEIASFTDDLIFTVSDITGASLFYDFDGNGTVDDTDVRNVSCRWNSEEGDEEYDLFYDLDDDGAITILDIMAVVNRMN